MFLQPTSRMAPSLANLSSARSFPLTGRPDGKSTSLSDLMLDWERFYCDPRDYRPASCP